MASLPPTLPPPSLNPYAPSSQGSQGDPNALAGAIALAAKQRQQASQAASALARKSHPQTLGQPPKRQENVATTSPQPQPNPQQPPIQKPTPPQAPPGATTGALSPTAAAAPQALSFKDQITAIQGQIAAANQQEIQAQQALKDAMAQPQPTMPSFTPPTMQPQNNGQVLGAALMALLAPKYAQGAIEGLKVNQEQREKAFDQATTAAKDTWSANLSRYEDEAKQRQEGIENTEKLDTAAGNRLSHLDTAYNTLQNDALRDKEAQDRLAETKREHDLIESRFLSNSAQRRAFHNDLITHYGQELGLREEQINVQRGRLALGAENLRWQAKKFGMNEQDIARLNGMRMATSLVIEKSREDAADGRQQNSSAARAVLQGQHDFNLLQQSFINHPNPNTALALAKFYSSPQGLKLNAALKQFGVSADMATDLLDSETSGAVDSAGNALTGSALTAPDAGAAGAGTTFNLNIGAQPGTSGTSVSGVGSGGGTTQQMLDEINKIAPGLAGTLGGGDHGGKAAQPPLAQPKKVQPPADPVVQQFQEDLPNALQSWSALLKKNGGDVNAAWKSMLPGFSGSHPREISMMRQALFAHARGAGNSGKARPPVRPSPAPPIRTPAPTPSPTQAPPVRPRARGTPMPTPSPAVLQWSDLY